VFLIGLLTSDRTLACSRLFLVSGTCKQEDAEAHTKLIIQVIAACRVESERIGCPLFCVASDGESRQGVSLSQLTEKQHLSESDKLYPLLSGMRLFNLLVGDDNLMVDKNAKHIFKQCHNFLLRKSGFQVHSIHISPTLLHLHLKAAGVSEIRLNALLNPADRQDIPTCYTLLKELWNLPDPAPTDKPTFIAARKALQTLGHLFRHLVLPYIQITLLLHEQLMHLSAVAHLAAFLFTFDNARSKVMPSLTYRDIILMVKNTYFCVAKAKVQKPESLFWLILLGTDRLEDDFGTVRSITGNDANADVYSLTTRMSHTVEVRNIFSLHPEWDRGLQCLKLPAIEDGNGDIIAKVDHINPASWKGDVQVSNVSPVTAWNEGHAVVEKAFSDLQVAQCFKEMEIIGADLYFPFGNGVALPADDENGDEDSANNKNPTTSSSEAPLSLNTVVFNETPSDPLDLEDHVGIEVTRDGRGKYCPHVDVGGGKMVSKACILHEMERFMFSKLPGSTDHATRIIGGSRYTSDTFVPTLSSPSTLGGAALCVGDPACTLVTCEGNTFLAIIHITDILVDSRSHLDIDLSLLFEPTVNLQFQICHFVEQTPQVNDASAIEDVEEWRWNGKLDSKVMTVKGSFIQVLNPNIVVEKVGQPLYTFRTDDLRLLAASLFASISVEDRPRLPLLKKRTAAFPYRSGGRLHSIHPITLTYQMVLHLDCAAFVCETESGVSSGSCLAIDAGQCAHCCPPVPLVVFGSPVRSGFLTSRAFNRDRNWSFYFRKVKKTGPNQCGPVHIGFLRLQDWLGPVKVQTS